MNFFHLHLVSDSTGETVSSVSRAALAQFDAVQHEEHLWTLVRTRGQLEKIIAGIEENPGIVMYTIVDKALRDQLKQACVRLGVPCISVLGRVIAQMSEYIGVASTPKLARQHQLTDEYFARVDCVNFALTHDDGQATWDLEDADMVLVGASRSSKSPTCMYLAYRGYKAANVPYVMGVPLPPIVLHLKRPLVVGLLIQPDRLMQIRRSRLVAMKENKETEYADIARIEEEQEELKRLYQKQRWPVIDVTRRSVEETAAAIIQKHHERAERK